MVWEGAIGRDCGMVLSRRWQKHRGAVWDGSPVQKGGANAEQKGESRVRNEEGGLKMEVELLDWAWGIVKSQLAMFHGLKERIGVV